MNAERIASDFRDGINENFTISRVSGLSDEMNETFAKVLEVLEMNYISSLREGEVSWEL